MKVVQILAVAVVTLAALPAAAAGQTFTSYFRADLVGTQVVPPTGSPGIAVVALLLPPSENSVSIFCRFTGLGSNATTMQLRGPAPPGGTGALIVSMAASNATAGSSSGSLPLSPAQLAELKAGLWYLELRSTHFPEGELRGQIVPSSPLLATMTGRQAVPPNTSAATGWVITHANLLGSQAQVYLEWTGLSGTATKLAIRGPAVGGTTGPIIIDFGGGYGTAFNATATLNLTLAQYFELRAGLWSWEVQTAAFPAGEIKGQIKLMGNVTDFDADGNAEAGQFRSSGNTWYLVNPATFAFAGQAFGLASDTRIPADFDGDGRTDIAVWRAGTFYVWQSRTNTLRVQPFGAPGDDPRISADFDGDGKADFAVYRPGAQSVLYVLRSLDGAVAAYPFGTTGDLSVFGSYDGDRKNDVAVYRPSLNTFFVLRSLDNSLAVQPWGSFAQDWITPGDYDGDGRHDFTVWRGIPGGDGNWYILQSGDGTLRVQPFGIAANTDQSVMADYDGDGKTDVAIARIGGGVQTWYILQSLTASLKAFVFGITSDQVIQLYLRR